jgi:hypothetical protein
MAAFAAKRAVVVDAVDVEPVSTRQFPANREKNREFYRIRTHPEVPSANTRAIPKAFSEIPYAIEQGFILVEQAIHAREQGILAAKIREHHRMRFSVHTSVNFCSPQLAMF